MIMMKTMIPEGQQKSNVKRETLILLTSLIMRNVDGHGNMNHQETTGGMTDILMMIESIEIETENIGEARDMTRKKGTIGTERAIDITRSIEAQIGTVKGRKNQIMILDVEAGTKIVALILTLILKQKIDAEVTKDETDVAPEVATTTATMIVTVGADIHRTEEGIEAEAGAEVEVEVEVEADEEL